MTKIEIGDKPLKEISPEQLLEIVMIEGCCPSLQYWNKPEVMHFNNKIFSDTSLIDFVSFRKEDSVRSCEYTFYFNHEDLWFHYKRDFEKEDNQYEPNGRRIGLATLKYLIEQGFDVPLYTVKP